MGTQYALLLDKSGRKFAIVAIGQMDYKMSKRRGLHLVQWFETRTRCRAVLLGAQQVDDFFLDDAALQLLHENRLLYRGVEYRVVWLSAADAQRVENEFFAEWD